MLRLSLIAALTLLAAPVSAAQSSDDAYASCLIGTTLMQHYQQGLETPAALEAAAIACESLAGATSDPAEVEESVIHLLDNQIFAMCSSETDNREGQQI